MIDQMIARRDLLKRELVDATNLLAKKKAEIEELNEKIRQVNGAIQALEEVIEAERQEDPGRQPGSSS